jgi:hypothetical protein
MLNSFQHLVNNPAAETTGRLFFECPFLGVIPASEARRESFRKDSGQAGMTGIRNCGRDHRVYLDNKINRLEIPKQVWDDTKILFLAT